MLTVILRTNSLSLVYQGKNMTNCEINNDSEKEFELDKLLYLLARFHLVYNFFLSAQVAVRNKATNICKKKKTNRGTTITTNTG